MNIEVFFAFVFVWLLITAAMAWFMAYPDNNFYAGIWPALQTQTIVAIIIAVLVAAYWSLKTILIFLIG